MKNIKFLYLVVGTLLLFTACDNDLPKFNDKNAFISFTNATLSVDENGGSLNVPVLLTSLSGLEGTVKFSVSENSTAKEGIHFNIKNGANTLTFTKESPTQYIQLEIIDNDTFDGDVNLTFILSEATNVELGADATCSVTILDDEHPLLFILGTFNVSAESLFDGAQTWNITIEKDEEDVSKVWIGGLVPDGTNQKVYGTVNDDKTELRIPVGQEIAVTSYYKVQLDGFYDPTVEDEDSLIPLGGYLTGIIEEDGTITIEEAFGSQILMEEGDEEGPWYNIIFGGAILKK